MSLSHGIYKISFYDTIPCTLYVHDINNCSLGHDSACKKPEPSMFFGQLFSNQIDLISNDYEEELFSAIKLKF